MAGSTVLRWWSPAIKSCAACYAVQMYTALDRHHITHHRNGKRWLHMASTNHINSGSEIVIKVPKGMSRKLESIESQTDGRIRWRGRIFTARPGKLLISAKRKEFNFYQNQKYDKFKPPVLASSGWKHNKSIGDYFTVLAYKRNPSFSSDPDNQFSFDTYKLDEHFKNVLQQMNIKTPSIIQNLVIPVISYGQNTLCAAETGSGKTLAYLLPIVQSLLVDSRPPRNVVADPGYPRVLIMVPARELAEQVSEVVKILLANTDLCGRYMQGNKNSLKSLRQNFEFPVDILVSTPGVLLKSLREGLVSLNSLSHVVIDEVDTMLDDSFSKDIINILRKVKISVFESDLKEGFAQLILVGATMPKQASQILHDLIPEDALQVVCTSQLHRIMPHVNQKFLRLHSTDKAERVIELVRKDDQANISVMVFCNEVLTCNWLSKLLEDNNIKVLMLHGSQTPEKRAGVMTSFKKGAANVLVCTDVSSRGVDTIKVRHVINFDFPCHMSDYIHRVGRVGRVGSQSSGHVTNFVVHKWDVDLVNKIERAVHVRLDLPRVNANIKQKLTRRIEEHDTLAMKQVLTTL